MVIQRVKAMSKLPTTQLKPLKVGNRILSEWCKAHKVVVLDVLIAADLVYRIGVAITAERQTALTSGESDG